MEITQELKDLVIKEATNLKKYAHADELAKLDFKKFDPQYGDCCIYGLMTGSCYSDRAGELIYKCAERVCVKLDLGNPKRCSRGLADKINGAPESPIRKFNVWSPIETFIYEQEREDLKPLIDFLKGETEILEL